MFIVFQCIVSTTSSTATTAVLDVQKLRLPSFEAHSNLVVTDRPQTYTGATGPLLELEPTSEELKLLEEHLSGSIAVRSTHQTERKAKRTRVAKQGSVNMVSMKSGSTNRKQRIDYSDPLCYLRGTTSISRLLTAKEEIKLLEGIQDLMQLESLQEELAERCGEQPTFAQWAAAAGVDQMTSRQCLNYGKFCNDKRIKATYGSLF